RPAAEFLQLAKRRIPFLVTLPALVGFVMGTRGAVELVPLLAALLGTALVAAGASTFNMVLEGRIDGLMRRTQTRPLPAGRLSLREAAAFGAVVTAPGL